MTSGPLLILLLILAILFIIVGTAKVKMHPFIVLLITAYGLGLLAGLSPEAVIQAITMTDQRYDKARHAVDYIKRYIFPGGCLPSINVIAGHLADDTDLQMVHLRDITEDYAETLAEWHRRFNEKLDTVRQMGFDERFIRMWQFYLSYCEGGFRERIIGTVQLAFAKPGYRFPGSLARA